MRCPSRAAALVFAGGLLLALAPTGPASAYGERVFNANEVLSALAFSVDTRTSVAQSFTPTQSFVLFNVTLYVANVGGGGKNDPLNVTIQTDAAGVPSGTELAWSSEVSSSGSLVWLDFPVAPRPTLLRNVTYWIVATSRESMGNGYVWVHSDGDIVPGLAAVNPLTGWNTTVGTDMTYVTYGMPAAPEMVVGLVADRFTVPPGGLFVLTVYLNNTGYSAALLSWVNATLPPAASYVSDTAADVGGVRTGPTDWTIPGPGNGPHSFNVSVRAAGNATLGTVLIAEAHLDYLDAAGVPQPPSTASARIVVGLQQKPMYLAFDGVPDRADSLTAAAPTGGLTDFDGDGVPGLTLSAGVGANWTLAPPVAQSLHLWGPASVTLYMESQAPGATVSFRVDLYDRGATVVLLASATRTVTFNSIADYEAFPFELGILDHWISRGNVTSLGVTDLGGGTAYLAYNATSVPSKVLVTTDTFVSIDSVLVEGASGPGTVFSTKDPVSVVANVSDPFGSDEIAQVTISLWNPDGQVLVTNAPMAPATRDARTPSAWRTFAHASGLSAKEGSYTFALAAFEGNGVRTEASGSFLVRIPILSLAANQNATSAPRLGLVRYSLYVNNTGTGNATAWLNATLPSGLTYASDNASAIGGLRTGESNWTIQSLGPGAHRFDVILRVGAAVPGDARLALRFELAYADEKGFPWAAAGVSFELLVLPGPNSPPASNPWTPEVLALLAFLAATPLVGYALWRRRRTQIEEVFLVHQHGVLLCHLSRRMRAQADKDDDVLGAMLTVVQDFVRDSFRYGKDREIDRIEFGDFRILIEQGKYVYLAVAFSGHEAPDLRKRMRRLVDEIETAYGVYLKAFDGDMEPLLGVRDIIGRTVRGR